MNDENKTLEIGRTEARFESENEIALPTQDRNQRNLALGSAVGGLLLLLTLVPILSRARRTGAISQFRSAALECGTRIPFGRNSAATR